jgi:hypothetical protein
MFDSHSPFVTDAEITHTDIRHLRYGEHLLVWLLRVARSSPGQCRMVLNEFHFAFGPLADEATGAIEALFMAMAKGKRAVLFVRPGEATLSHDELLVLALFNAAQREDEAEFHARARFILADDRTEDLWQASVRLTALLTLRGYGLRAVATRTQIDHSAGVTGARPVVLNTIKANRSMATKVRIEPKPTTGAAHAVAAIEP